MGATDDLAAALRDLTEKTPTITTATVTSASPLRVDGADGDVELKALGSYDPSIGDQVWVVRLAGSGFILGSPTPNQRPPATGTVTAYTAGQPRVTVSAGGGSYTLPKGKSWTPTVGELCALLWTPSASGSDTVWSGVAVDGIGAAPTAAPFQKTSAPTDPVPAVDTPGPETSGTATVAAVQNGTWSGGQWATDTPKVEQGVYNGRVYEGFWFYGGRFTQYAGVRVTQAWIRLPVGGGGAATPTPVRLRLHDADTKTGTRPAWVGGEIAAPAAADNATLRAPIPAAAVQQLIDGTAEGIGVASTTPGEYTTLLGITGTQDTPRDLLSGAVEFDYERTV